MVLQGNTIFPPPLAALNPLPSPQPTVCHYFMRLLKEKGLLLRCYTQVCPPVVPPPRG